MGEGKLAFVASTLCRNKGKEQAKSGEAQMENPAGLAMHEATSCSVQVLGSSVL